MHQLENEIKKRVREMKADEVQHAFDRLDYTFFLLAPGCVPPSSFLGKILVQRQNTAEEGGNPICNTAEWIAWLTMIFVPANPAVLSRTNIRSSALLNIGDAPSSVPSGRRVTSSTSMLSPGASLENDNPD